MTMTTWCALAIVLSLTRSAAPPSTALQTQSDAELRELSSYILTTATMDKVDRAVRLTFDEMKKDKKFAEAMKIEAEIAALKQKSGLTEAEVKRVEELTRRLAALDSSNAMNMDGARTIAQLSADVEKFKPMMTALRSVGLTAREYAKFMIAVMKAVLVARFQKSGVLKELPAGTNPANVRFMIEHEEDFQRMQAAWGSLGR